MLSLKSLLYNLLILTIFPLSTIFSQVIFRDLPDYKLNSAELLFFDITDTRQIISLNGNWQVYSADDDEKKTVTVKVPSIFDGEGEFVFGKEFTLSTKQLIENKIKLVFFGLNYSADISVNNAIIYRHPGGELPFSVSLPRDILKSDGKNIISISLSYELDSKNTIPLKQRFLFPQNFGGIIRDVYLHLEPNISIRNPQVTSLIDLKSNKASVEIEALVENKEFRNFPDSLGISNTFKVNAIVYAPDGSTTFPGKDTEFSLARNKDFEFKNSISIPNPEYWSFDNPASYLVRIELFRGDKLIDRYDQRISIFSLEVNQENILLTGKEIELRGVTYIPSFKNFGSLSSYSQMENDLEKIKSTGFNSVRFSKATPHPYLLFLCESIGLLPIVEFPLANVPEGIANDQNFSVRTKNFLNYLIDAYDKYSVFKIVGFGSSYISNFESHQSLIRNLSLQVKERYNLITFASFYNYDLQPIDNLDLYGIETLNENISVHESKIEQTFEKIGKGRLIIGEATYFVNVGQTDGYVNDYSYEAQAKFFDDLFVFAQAKGLAGFYINTMFDIRGDYASLISSYDIENNYNIGLIGENRKTEHLAYKVLSARLKNSEKVTIPIGSEKDDAPMIFIVTGLLLALIMGVLVNSGKKFRDDASRALLRPYNFFADVRDQRIISAYHSLFLAVVIGLINSLIVSNLLYYLKTSIFFEKFLLSFASPSLMSGLSYLAWHPVQAIIWLFILTIIAIVITVLMIQAASFFVRTKVYLSGVFFTVVWALLPIVLLIPVGIVLYRILNSGVANIYVFIVLIAIKIWLIYRLIKGIYVIFDAKPSTVYFYSIIFILAISGIILLNFEVSSSVVQYISLTLKQFNII